MSLPEGRDRAGRHRCLPFCRQLSAPADFSFTTIDFHSGTQKLAVGTHEGAVIMYDLKSASRLYVLEAHKGPVSAVAFSPDGRRLVTVSLVDHTVTVWKVGSSLSGFFNVGGPPRQGGKPGEPYKRIPFVRPNAGEFQGASADVVHCRRSVTERCCRSTHCGLAPPSTAPLAVPPFCSPTANSRSKRGHWCTIRCGHPVAWEPTGAGDDQGNGAQF